MEEILIKATFILMIFNLIISFPLLRINDKFKFISEVVSLSAGLATSIFLVFKFYLYHISPVVMYNYEIFDFSRSGYLFILMFSFLLPVITSWKEFFENNALRLLFYNISLVLLILGLIMPIWDIIVFFVALILFFYVLLGFSFYLSKTVWFVSKIIYAITILLLLMPLIGLNVRWLNHFYEVYIFIILINILSPYFVNIWSYFVIKDVPYIMSLVLYSILFFAGYYLLSRFLLCAKDVIFYKITAIVGITSAIFSILHSIKEKRFNEFFFFVLVSVSGIALMMLGLSPYIGDLYKTVSIFYIFSTYFAVAGLLLLYKLKKKGNNNYIILLLSGVFYVLLSGLPPFSVFFSKISVLLELISYGMWWWVTGFVLVWILQSWIILKWFSKELSQVSLLRKVKVSPIRLVIPFILVGLIIFASYLGGYYVNGFWGLKYLPFYILVAIYVVDLFLPRIFSALVATAGFVLLFYDYHTGIIFKATLILWGGYFVWSIFDSKSKGLIPLIWLLISSAVGVFQSQNVVVFSYWLMFSTLISFLLLLFNRLDKVSIKAASSYLFLSLIGDFVIILTLFYSYDSTQVLSIKEAVEVINGSKFLSVMLFTGFILKLPVTGLNYWLQKISIEYITISFFPILIFIKLFISGFSYDCLDLFAPLILFSILYSVVKSIDSNSVYSYLKQIIPVSINMILILLMILGANDSVLLFSIQSFVFIVFIYLVALYMVIMYDSDKFSGFGNFLRRNLVVGLLVYLTFIWFYGFGIVGAFISEKVLLRMPILIYTILSLFGVSLAYFMYSIFAEGVNVKHTNNITLPFSLFLLIIFSASVIWLIPVFTTGISSNWLVMILSSVFFFLLYLAFKYGNIATGLRFSKFFDVVRSFNVNILEKHQQRLLEDISEILLILYRDKRGLLFNILLFFIIVFFIAW